MSQNFSSIPKWCRTSSVAAQPLDSTIIAGISDPTGLASKAKEKKNQAVTHHLRQQLRIVRNEIDKISEELHEPETETCTPGVSCNEDEEVQRILRSKLLTLIDQEEKLTQEIKSSKVPGYCIPVNFLQTPPRSANEQYAEADLLDVCEPPALRMPALQEVWKVKTKRKAVEEKFQKSSSYLSHLKKELRTVKEKIERCSRELNSEGISLNNGESEAQDLSEAEEEDDKAGIRAQLLRLISEEDCLTQEIEKTQRQLIKAGLEEHVLFSETETNMMPLLHAYDCRRNFLTQKRALKEHTLIRSARKLKAKATKAALKAVKDTQILKRQRNEETVERFRKAKETRRKVAPHLKLTLRKRADQKESVDWDKQDSHITKKRMLAKLKEEIESQRGASMEHVKHEQKRHSSITEAKEKLREELRAAGKNPYFIEHLVKIEERRARIQRQALQKEMERLTELQREFEIAEKAKKKEEFMRKKWDKFWKENLKKKKAKQGGLDSARSDGEGEGDEFAFTDEEVPMVRLDGVASAESISENAPPVTPASSTRRSVGGDSARSESDVSHHESPDHDHDHDHEHKHHSRKSRHKKKLHSEDRLTHQSSHTMDDDHGHVHSSLSKSADGHGHHGSKSKHGKKSKFHHQHDDKDPDRLSSGTTNMDALTPLPTPSGTAGDSGQMSKGVSFISMMVNVSAGSSANPHGDMGPVRESKRKVESFQGKKPNLKDSGKPTFRCDPPVITFSDYEVSIPYKKTLTVVNISCCRARFYLKDFYDDNQQNKPENSKSIANVVQLKNSAGAALSPGLAHDVTLTFNTPTLQNYKGWLLFQVEGASTFQVQVLCLTKRYCPTVNPSKLVFNNIVARTSGFLKVKLGNKGAKVGTLAMIEQMDAKTRTVGTPVTPVTEDKLTPDILFDHHGNLSLDSQSVMPFDPMEDIRQKSTSSAKSFAGGEQHSTHEGHGHSSFAGPGHGHGRHSKPHGKKNKRHSESHQDHDDHHDHDQQHLRIVEDPDHKHHGNSPRESRMSRMSQNSSAPLKSIKRGSSVKAVVAKQMHDMLWELAEKVASDVFIAYVKECNRQTQPKEERTIIVFFRPPAVDTYRTTFRLSFEEEEADDIFLEVEGKAVENPVQVDPIASDFKICMMGHNYTQVVNVITSISGPTKIIPEVPDELNSFVHVTPTGVTAFAKTPGRFVVKFHPSSMLLHESCPAFKFVDKRMKIIDFPVNFHVSSAAFKLVSPVTATFMAVLTDPSLAFHPTEIDMGICWTNETVLKTFTVQNLSMLQQNIGFVGVPKNITIQPAFGFATLLPQEKRSFDLLMSLPSDYPPGKHECVLKCESIQLKEYELKVKFHAKSSHVFLSETQIEFPVTPMGSDCVAKLDLFWDTKYMVHEHSQHSTHTKDATFEFAVNPLHPITVIPSAGHIHPGETIKIMVEFEARVTEKQVKDKMITNMTEDHARKKAALEKELEEVDAALIDMTYDFGKNRCEFVNGEWVALPPLPVEQRKSVDWNEVYSSSDGKDVEFQGEDENVQEIMPPKKKLSKLKKKWKEGEKKISIINSFKKKGKSKSGGVAGTQSSSSGSKSGSTPDEEKESSPPEERKKSSPPSAPKWPTSAETQLLGTYKQLKFRQTEIRAQLAIPFTTPDPDEIDVNSPTYAKSKLDLMKNSATTSQHYSVPCYVWDHEGDYNTLLLNIRGAAITQPSLIVLEENRTVDFGSVAIGKKEYQTIHILNVTTSPFKIKVDGLNPSCPFVICNAARTIPPDFVFQLKIKFEPKEAGNFSETFRVLAEKNTFTLTLIGSGT